MGIERERKRFKLLGVYRALLALVIKRNRGEYSL